MWIFILSELARRHLTVAAIYHRRCVSQDRSWCKSPANCKKHDCIIVKTLPVLFSKEFNHFKFGVFHALCIFQDCHFGHPLPPERWVHCPNITFRIFSSSLVGQRAPLGMGDVENSWIGLESLPWIWPMSFSSRFPLHVRLHISTYHHICTSTCSTMELRHFSTRPSGRDVSETNTVQTGREGLAKV